MEVMRTTVDWQESFLNPDNALTVLIPENGYGPDLEGCRELVSGYDDEFFKDHALIVMLYGVWGPIDGVSLSASDGTLLLQIDQIRPMLTVMQTNYLCIEIDDAALDGIEEIRATVSFDGDREPLVFTLNAD